jgi:glutamine amidotransferase
VHSYFPEPEDASIISATSEYGEVYAAAICRGKLVATQFHPEKSQKLGLKLLENFLNV